MFFRAATRAQQQPVEQDNPSSNLSRKKSAEADAVAGVLGRAGTTSLATSANSRASVLDDTPPVAVTFTAGPGDSSTAVSSDARQRRRLPRAQGA